MLPAIVHDIVNAVNYAGGKIYLVGGAVRDYVMSGGSFDSIDDLDFEVFGIPGSELHRLLSCYAEVTTAGKFSIFTICSDGMELQFSLPRRETKTGRGYTAFDIEVDPTMTVAEAAARRDFTINAMYMELPSMRIIDPFDGIEDIKDGILSATSEHFVEDPMRVMRAFAFVSRFGYALENNVIAYAQHLLSEADTLNTNLLWKQFKKWAFGAYPGKALYELQLTGWLRVFPALDNMVGVQQEPRHHPEGDVFVHTRYVVDAMSKIIRREGITDDDTVVVLMLTALLHDVGKAVTTEYIEGKGWTAYGHPEAGVPIAEQFLNQIGAPSRIIDRVLPLVREHMAHIPFFTNEVTPRTVRRIAQRLGKATIQELMYVIEADHSGRPPLPGGLPERARAILSLSESLQVDKGSPAPILLGRHLVGLGMRPGKHFGTILKAAYEAQLAGEFHDVDSGIQWLRSVREWE